MGFFEEYTGDILAAPIGKKTRKVSLTFVGVNEMNKEQLKNVAIGGMATFDFIFKSGDTECTITKNQAKKTAQGWQKYKFVKNFIDNMRLVAGLEVGEKNSKMIGKEFTILIYNNANGLPEYDIYLGDDSEDTGSEEDTENNPF